MAVFHSNSLDSQVREDLTCCIKHTCSYNFCVSTSWYSTCTLLVVYITSTVMFCIHITTANWYKVHTILLCNFSGQPSFFQCQQSIANSVPVFNCCFCSFVEPPFQHFSETFLCAAIYMVIFDLVQNMGISLKQLDANIFPPMLYFLKCVIHLIQLSVSWGDRDSVYQAFPCI